MRSFQLCTYQNYSNEFQNCIALTISNRFSPLNRRLQAYIDMTPFKKSYKGHTEAEFVEHAKPAKPSSLPVLLQDLSDDEIKILEKKMIRKVDWRMLPLIILMYILVRLRVASVFVFHGLGGS